MPANVISIAKANTNFTWEEYNFFLTYSNNVVNIVAYKWCPVFFARLRHALGKDYDTH